MISDMLYDILYVWYCKIFFVFIVCNIYISYKGQSSSTRDSKLNLFLRGPDAARDEGNSTHLLLLFFLEEIFAPMRMCALESLPRDIVSLHRSIRSQSCPCTFLRKKRRIAIVLECSNNLYFD